MIQYTRTKKGRFAKGNAGGPGRPRRKDELIRTFLREIERVIESPHLFTARQRRALVRLTTDLMNGSDEQAIAAASILVRMDNFTLRSQD